jgi:hypothetical protein
VLKNRAPQDIEDAIVALAIERPSVRSASPMIGIPRCSVGLTANALERVK